MTELEKLMRRIDSLETELIKNRDFLTKTHSLCFDEKTKADVTACINSKLDLINWIKDLARVIQADSRLSKERESKMGIWDKAIVSAGMCAEHMTNVLNMTVYLQGDNLFLSEKRIAARDLRDACWKFSAEMNKIVLQEGKNKEKENDGND